MKSPIYSRLVLLNFVVILTLILESTADTNSDDSPRVVVLGSSTAAGVGPDDPDNAWVNRYRAFMQNYWPESEVINLAVGGYTTYHVMPSDYIPPESRPEPDPQHNITRALTYNPTAIIVNLPSNDAAWGFSVNETMTNFETIYDIGTVQGIPVWIATTQPVNYGEAIKDKQIATRDAIYASFGGYAIDFWSVIALQNGYIDPIYDSGDGVHLNDAAHGILYQRVVNAGAGFPDNSLPVSLSSFYAVAENKKVNLYWVTETELRNKAFIIEKSNNGQDYSLLTEIEGNGTVSYRNEYQFTDNQVINGKKYYYRLSDRDYNGYNSFSEIVTAVPNTTETEKILNISIYPNPFNTQTNIHFSNHDHNWNIDNMRIDIYNIIGEHVQTLFEGQVKEEDIRLRWEGTDAAGVQQSSGVYILSLSSNKFFSSKKIFMVK